MSDLQLRLTNNSEIPLYLQLKYQLSYLITSAKLSEGSRLPAVRDLARRLRINPGTVVQAYRELQYDGLAISNQGHGTFVAPLLPHQQDASIRQELLTSALDEALRRARALGFSDMEIQQRFAAILSAGTRPREVAFVGPTVAIAHKYASLLGRHLRQEVEALPVTMDELLSEETSAMAALNHIYYVITFALQVHKLEKLLRERGMTCRVLGVATSVVHETLHALAELPENLRVCLVTQEPYLHAALNIILRHSRITGDRIEQVLDTHPERIPAVAAEADLVIYTFGVRDLLNEFDIPVERRLELVFDISPDSLIKLRRLLAPCAAQAH